MSKAMLAFESTRRDVLFAIVFGILSLLMGQVQFSMPGVAGSVTSLNEIPSLIAVFYLSNPLYLILVSAISSLGTPADGSAISTLVFHVGGLIPFWYFYHFVIKRKELNQLSIFLSVGLGVVLYYLILIIPLMVLINQIIGINEEAFVPFYQRVVRSSSFELTTTAIIVPLYLLQLNANDKLKGHLVELEERVSERTIELDKTIQKLNSTNVELASMNERLDQMVKQRTDELEHRNIQLTGYAFVNSHMLRAPLARLLGLSTIIRNELESLDDIELLEKFMITCNELDQVVKVMSEFLSEESILSTHQLNELQDRIRQIAVEIKAIP